MTHSYVSHSSSICTTCRADTTIRHDFFEFGKWFIVRATRTQCLAIAYFKTPPLPRDVTCWRYTWHDAFIRVTWLIHMQQDSLVCVTWLIYMCGMTHSYVWHDPFICVTRPIHMCDTTHSYVWHDPFTCVTWLIGICDMTDLYVWHDWLIRNMTWLIHVCVMTHVTYESWPFSVHAKGAVTHIYEKVTQIIYEKKVQVAHSVDAKGAHIICVTRKEQSHTYMTWNYGFLLQKSPMKETIFCKRDVSYYMCDTFGAVTHIYDLTAFKKPSYRVAKTHRIPYLYRLFSPKVTYI